MTTDAWPEWQVTKLDAARRQLETSIRLLFEEGDAVSVHTLAHASFGILKGVAETRGERRVLDAGEELAAARGKKDFWNNFNRTGNFFKHGDKDPEGLLSGTPEDENEALISLAVEIYRDLKGLATPELQAFFLWWRFTHFEGVDDISEPVISWLESNAERLHAEDRPELLAMGHELYVLLRDQENASPAPRVA